MPRLVQLSFWNNLDPCTPSPTLHFDMLTDIFFMVRPHLWRSHCSIALRFQVVPVEVSSVQALTADIFEHKPSSTSLE